MNNKSKQLLWGIVLGLIFCLALGTVLLPKKEYSEQENRYLEDFPKISVETVLDTSFMQDLETYLSDHFVLRDSFMTLRTWYERLTGKNRINGIYLCEDGFYIEEYEKPENIFRIVSALERLDKGIKTAETTVMIVPTAVTVYGDKLPLTAKNADQRAVLASIYEEAEQKTEKLKLLDVTDALCTQAEEEQLYYKLDHHWTTAGAYYAYAEYCRFLGFSPVERSAFDETVVTDAFQGTIYSKLNDITAGADSMVQFGQEDIELTVLYEKEKETDSLYAPEYLEKKDKYSYFLDNIHPFIQITNHSAQTEDALFLIKDSYANCMVPFLVNHYKTIYVADTRYYKESVTEFINEHEEIKDVLMLYNLGTIDTDLGIGGIY